MTLSCHLGGGMGSSRTRPAGQGNNRPVSVTCGVSNISFIKMQTRFLSSATYQCYQLYRFICMDLLNIIKSNHLTLVHYLIIHQNLVR